MYSYFFFNDTATTEIYTLSLHDALPIFLYRQIFALVFLDGQRGSGYSLERTFGYHAFTYRIIQRSSDIAQDRKSTRLNSSHANISYAVFCLKKKKKKLWLL